MANIIQNTQLLNKTFAYKDNSESKSFHLHSSSDIIDGAVAILNKNNPSNIEELRANLGITYGSLLPTNPTQGAIHFYKRTEPIAVSEGGTGCMRNYDVRQKFNLIGVNLVSTSTDDVSTWANLGTGVVFINGTRVDEQPFSQGFIHNHVYLDTVFQVWYSLGGLGEMYIRSGDANGWHTANGLWVRMYNQNTTNKRIYSGEISKGDKVNIGEELTNYTLFKVVLKGKGTTVLCVKEGDYFRGIGGYSDSGTATGSMTTYHVNCDIVNNTYLKCVQCNQITHQFEGGHNYFSDNVISTIYGLI